MSYLYLLMNYSRYYRRVPDVVLIPFPQPAELNFGTLDNFPQDWCSAEGPTQIFGIPCAINVEDDYGRRLSSTYWILPL